MTEQQVNNIYINCNRPGVDMEELLRLCLDPESKITIEGLRAANYKKIEQLEQRYNIEAESIIWAKSQNSIDVLSKFIKKCEQGVFSHAHLHEAKDKLRELAAIEEDKEWNRVSMSDNINDVMAFISKIRENIYSKTYHESALARAELMDWNMAKNSRDPMVLNGYIQKCNTRFYATTHIDEAKELLEELVNGTIVADWNKVMSETNLDTRVIKINEFIQKYAMNPSETAAKYIDKASKELQRIAEEKEARKDWIDAKAINTILGYVEFTQKHPYSDYREEADRCIQEMKGDLLSDMKRYPFKYPRELMYDYINSGALTMVDLVDRSYTLTDRAYSHIRNHPTLASEQRDLPVSQLENPTSEAGNTDIYFFGVSGSGKTCVLAGLMSLTGQLGFRFDPKGPGGGGNYAMELKKYARTSMLPPATDQNYIQVIDGEINDEDNNVHKISLIEMSGEKTALNKYLYSSSCAYLFKQVDNLFKKSSYSEKTIKSSEDMLTFLNDKLDDYGTNSNLTEASNMLSEYHQLLGAITFNSTARYSRPLKAFSAISADAAASRVKNLKYYRSHFSKNPSIREKVDKIASNRAKAEAEYYANLEKEIEKHFKSSGNDIELLEDQIRFDEISTNDAAISKLNSFVNNSNR